MKNAKTAALSTKIHSAPLYTVESDLIHFVGSAKEWPDCEARLRTAKVVGIDSETRPVFHGKQKANPCSLLQLAVRGADGKREVFVLDLLKLQPKVYNAALSRLFLSKQVIKLGQGLMSDLKDLVASYPAASCFSVAKAVVEVNDLSISLMGPHHAISLQKLAYFYINKRLTKTMQTSNWDRRPLSPSQLHYAASDALVLIDIYDELIKRLQEHTNGKFQVESVMNVLDVHVDASPKCTLCFEVFEAAAQLKAHRRECIKTVGSLSVCATCDTMLLLDVASMEAHTSVCGNPDRPTEEDVEVLKPVEVSGASLASAPVKIKKRKKRARSGSGHERADAGSAAVHAPASGGRKKDETKKERPRVRKMSAGTLLAADDIWCEISANLVSDQPSP